MKDKKRSLVFGHRGASGYCPENTLVSFKKAFEMGADGVELDVQLTSDGEVVVIHDETLERVSNGEGFVKDHSFAELRALNYNKTHPEFEYETIPALEEVLQLIVGTDKQINIELKTGVFPYEGIEEKVLALVKKYGLEKQIIYSSFNHETCMRIRELQPDAYIGFLYQDVFLHVPEYAKENGADAIHPAFWLALNPLTVKKAHQLGLEINTWTVNEPAYIKLCCSYGIERIITNYPDVALQIVNGD